MTDPALEHNDPSAAAVAGPDQGPNPDAVRLVYADRAAAPELLAEMTQAG